MANILAIDDEEGILELIKAALLKEGHQVTTVSNFSTFHVEQCSHYDLILLDVMMPDIDGFTLCRNIRDLVDCPILFLTAKTMEEDIIKGLGMGGDDYITKPFGFMVLMSKINALLRRNSNNKSCEKIVSKDIAFYPQELKVLKNNEEIILSKTELKLLNYLMTNGGQILKREQLLNELWDLDGEFVDPNTIAVNIRRLREKIEENPSNPKYIKAVRGIGYIWTERCVKQ